MLLDIARRLGRLFNEISEEGSAPDAPEADERGMIDEVGEQRAPLTSFGYLRDLLPTLRVLTPSQPGIAMTADEVAAWDMLWQHDFSRRALEKSGELEAYLSLNVGPETEAHWRRSYVNGLLEAGAAHPEGLDAAICIAAEYGDAPAMARALECLDDAVTGERLRDGAVLGSCLNAAMALKDGRLDDAFAADAATQVRETAHRAGRRLCEVAPDSPWLRAVPEIDRLLGQLFPARD